MASSEPDPGRVSNPSRVSNPGVLLTGVGKRYDIVAAFAQHATVVSCWAKAATMS